MRQAVRVLLLVENNSYPFDFRVRREAQALRDAGYRVSVIAPRAPGQRWREEIDGIRVHRFPQPPGGRGIAGYAFEFLYATLAMGALAGWVVLREGVDVVHAANPPDVLCAIGAVAGLCGKKFVFDQHDLSPEIYLSRSARQRKDIAYRCLRLAERCAYAAADVVIATNESYRQLAIERGGKPADKVFVVRNGPPLSYQPMPPDPALRGRAAHLIGYVGMIGPQDGLDYWLRAIAHMVHRLGRRDFLAVIIGHGDALPGIQALAGELGIEPWVHFTGLLPEQEARRHLSATTVCIQPDPSSPLNDKSTMNKMMEYMALSKPSVAFDLPETRRSAEGAALYAQANDEQDFAARVCWLLDRPEECARMGEIGRRRVAESLAWEHSVPRLLRAYADGLGLGPA
ncbi:glycosyltransferase family 4 protein [Aquincola sp. MAHUQ-54]|uniref:Glycosyltransferase family 4 protein n=1 Tax=Aquincola agrisoli TaxID=3119538 RepID=A0AAW9Q9N1_9BURK